jgi:hypothetical protein
MPLYKLSNTPSWPNPWQRIADNGAALSGRDREITGNHRRNTVKTP